MQTGELLSILWRRKWWFLATFVVVVAVAAAITSSLAKVYTASTFLIVQPSNPAATDFEATQISTALNTTYSRLLETRTVGLEVRDALPEGVDPELVGDVSIESVPESQLIEVKAEGMSREEARTIANTYAEVFVDLSDTLFSDTVSSGRVRVATPAALPTDASRPRPKLYLALAALFGMLLGAGVALLRHRTDQRLQVAPDQTELFGLPIIARIPQSATRAVEELAHGDAGGRSEARSLAEGFRLLLANLAFANLGERPRSVAVLSSAPSEGKSITALSIGRAASELGIETLLVDADLRRPSLTAKVGVDLRTEHGLSSFLVRSALSLTEASAEIDDNLQLVPAGPIPPNPAALLGSKALPEFDRRAQRAYELVIYDTPPLSVGADASLVASITEGAILVLDVRNSKRKVVLQAVDQLRRSRANVLGVVLNRVPAAAITSYGYYGEPVAAATAEPPQA